MYSVPRGILVTVTYLICTPCEAGTLTVPAFFLQSKVVGSHVRETWVPIQCGHFLAFRTWKNHFILLSPSSLLGRGDDLASGLRG